MRWFKLITLLPEDKFYEYMRVDRRLFIYLVRQYQRYNTTTRTHPLFHFIFIALGLNRLDHGLTFRQLGLHFGYSYSRAQKLFTQFLDFVNRVLLEKWVIYPDFEMCQVFEREFRAEVGIPGAVGAMDGTYIHYQGQGPHCEDFRNRKKLFNIIAQLICDYSGYIYDFYVGWPGSVNDARVFQHSPARHKIELGGRYDYVIVSDAAYGLRDYIHTPYRALPGRGLPDEQCVWNLQQSRARMIVEQVNGRAQDALADAGRPAGVGHFPRPAIRLRLHRAAQYRSAPRPPPPASPSARAQHVVAGRPCRRNAALLAAGGGLHSCSSSRSDGGVPLRFLQAGAS
ncbi:unnamed protein product [Closterium sp. Yama58-4]|nr:unnamed protein product [Closterium sp. Yama58-4]